MECVRPQRPGTLGGTIPPRRRRRSAGSGGRAQFRPSAGWPSRRRSSKARRVRVHRLPRFAGTSRSRPANFRHFLQLLSDGVARRAAGSSARLATARSTSALRAGSVARLLGRSTRQASQTRQRNCWWPQTFLPFLTMRSMPHAVHCGAASASGHCWSVSIEVLQRSPPGSPH